LVTPLLLLLLALLSPAPASAAVCVPLVADQPPFCPDTSLQPILDAADEAAATAGDPLDRNTPDPEACWETVSTPAFDYLDGVSTLHAESVGQLQSGCGHPVRGGTTVYYPKAYMHDGYDHSSNYNHKLSNHFRAWRHNGCNSSLCTYRVYSTNSRNNVINGLTVSGFGDNVGIDFNRRAARDLCGWIFHSSLNFAHPKPYVSCYYQYG
jgi:hypothetical protein